MIKDSKGRPVCDIEFEFNNDGSAFIGSASYSDAGHLYAEVPDSELDYLQDTYPELLADAELDSMIMRAEAYYGGDR